MREEKYYCDKCGTEIQSTKGRSFSLNIGRSMDPAGSMENDYSDGDYCVTCVRNALQRYFKSKPYSEAKEFLQHLKK